MPGRRASARTPVTSSVASSRVSLFAATSSELLTLLYRHIQTDYGLPALAEPWTRLAFPTSLRPAADWFFRGDIALGMNVIPLAYERGWRNAGDLAAGIGSVAPDDLARTMLRPPDTTVAGRRRRDHEVTAALAAPASEGPRTSLLAQTHAERFDTSAVKALLDDPDNAAQAFTRLVGEYAQAISVHEDELRGPLLAAASQAETLLAELPVDQAARRLFPQWQVHDLAKFDRVVLIPSHAIAPFLSARFTANHQALIVYPVGTAGHPPVTELATALRAIAHPLRLEILRLATAVPVTGQELAGMLAVTEPTVHHHTTLLRAAGLLASSRDAHRVYHEAVPAALDALFRDTLDAIRLPQKEPAISTYPDGGERY
jgi:DNA-binding transcriptional ArsR family regulator